MSLRTLLVVYVLGGLTFVPLLILSVLALAYYTLPRVSQDAGKRIDLAASKLTSDSDSDLTKDDGFADKEDAPGGSGNDAAGYFAVCREYVPGGVNGKPPERSSPAGEVLNSESPSVYQSMYRSIFERGKTQNTALEGDKKDPKAVKRPRNVFFVVVRHAHILLFDNSDQLEVRHVISLLHHDVDLYGGDEELSEGDLWIKKNCIRLTRRSLPGHTGNTSQPFYIFSDNCSDKEDFYHALLLAQFTARDTENVLSPKPRKFETDHIIKLVQALHTNDSDHHSRWFNALLGRIFLAIYKTEDIRAAVKAKIDRKISRVPKPNFITSIQAQSVDMGDAAPVFSNWKLKELNIDGALTVEADVKYTGGFRLQIAAIARIELGSRIRAREVDLVLAGVLRKLSGHILIKIKPPPSNRLWISFETIPQMDIAVEPVVSSMQITYGFILRAIESRIREVVGETLVYPNWDDMPFFDTEDYDCRGGIWDASRKQTSRPVRDSASEFVGMNTVDRKSPRLDSIDTGLDSIDKIPPISPKTISMPNLLPSPTKDVTSRKQARKPVATENDNASVHSTSTSISTRDATPTPTPPRSKPSSPRIAPADRAHEKPKPLRSNSFASPTTALVSTTDDITPTVTRSMTPRGKGARDAADYVKEVKNRSESISARFQPSFVESGTNSALNSPSEDEGSRRSNPDTVAANSAEASFAADIKTPPMPSATFPSDKIPASADRGQANRRSWNLSTTPPQGGVLEKGMNVAKSWGISMINRQNGRGNSVSGFTSLAKEAGIEDKGSEGAKAAALASARGKAEDVPDCTSKAGENSAVGERGQAKTSGKSGKEREPMGRGQPLPPLGAPLPGPKPSLWAGSNFNIAGTFKRKAVPFGAHEAGSAGHAKHEDVEHDQHTTHGDPEGQAATREQKRKSSGPILHERRRSSARFLEDETSSDQEVLVVAAPAVDDDAASARYSEDEGDLGDSTATLQPSDDHGNMNALSQSSDKAITSEASTASLSRPRKAAAADPDASHTQVEHAPPPQSQTDPISTTSSVEDSENPPPLPARSHTPSPTKTSAPSLPNTTAPREAVPTISTSSSAEDISTTSKEDKTSSMAAASVAPPSPQQAAKPPAASKGSVKGKGGWYTSAFVGGGTVRANSGAQATKGSGKGKEKGD
ncbi:hypothetical protein KVT40_007841 [Elsinoe batatas]|uniref:SMP-LTD domain-containing protein n=1 Tax=Elsinoe batatas TaxID=2601811 RepID=A0A8K0KXU4_9PEZI|nr:hypothetical protein KVT40_007841 [Elsinoe batatas]